MQGALPPDELRCSASAVTRKFLFAFLLLQMAKNEVSQNCDELYWKILPL